MFPLKADYDDFAENPSSSNRKEKKDSTASKDFNTGNNDGYGNSGGGNMPNEQSIMPALEKLYKNLL